jgi:voltage-gated potassium channel
MTSERRLSVALAAIVGVMAAGTVGYRLLGLSWLDASYQTVMTVTTVGFRELGTFGAEEKVFTILLMLGGIAVVLYTFSTLMEFAIEGHLGHAVIRRRNARRVRSMHDHVVLCGWGRVGKAIASALEHEGKPFVVVDSDPLRLEGVGHPTVTGDATDDEVLRAAGIDRAGALVATLDSDAANLFVTLSAKALRSDLFVVARAREESSIAKLSRAGADRVVNPQQLGGARIAAFITQPHVAEFVDVVMHDRTVEYRLEEVPLSPGSPLAGLTVHEARLRDLTGALVLALRSEDGVFITNPRSDTRMQPGQVVIAVGTPPQLEALLALAKGSPLR